MLARLIQQPYTVSKVGSAVEQAMHKQMLLSGTLMQVKFAGIDDVVRTVLTVLIWHGGLC